MINIKSIKILKKPTEAVQLYFLRKKALRLVMALPESARGEILSRVKTESEARTLFSKLSAKQKIKYLHHLRRVVAHRAPETCTELEKNEKRTREYAPRVR